jgi:anti-sigma regulatory factor (Ser/Thr protein kinase)
VNGLRRFGYRSDVSAVPDSSATGSPNGEAVNLTLDAVPENAAVARRAVARAAEQVGLDGETVAKARLVVSEAFSNATAHAYPDERDGEVEVAVYPDPAGITVVVRDHGEGLRPRPASGATTERLGLLLIAALATTTRLRQLPGGGTEVRADITSSRNGG